MSRIITSASAVALVALSGACGGDSSSGGRTVGISITDKACEPAELTLPSGSTTFHVKNNGANNITEFEVLDSSGKIIGEKENLTPGLEGKVTITLQPGDYTLACPGGTEHPTGRLTVTSSASSPSGTAHGHSDETGGGVPP